MNPTSDHALEALIVDDDAIVRMDALMILSDAGFNAREAHSGDQALEMLEEIHGRIGLLFTDVDMPTGSIDGFELAWEVAARWPDVGILVASGRHAPGPGDLPSGATFVPKPFSGGVGRDRLRELIPVDRRPEPLRE